MLSHGEHTRKPERWGKTRVWVGNRFCFSDTGQMDCIQWIPTEVVRLSHVQVLFKRLRLCTRAMMCSAHCHPGSRAGRRPDPNSRPSVRPWTWQVPTPLTTVSSTAASRQLPDPQPVVPTEHTEWQTSEGTHTCPVLPLLWLFWGHMPGASKGWDMAAWWVGDGAAWVTDGREQLPHARILRWNPACPTLSPHGGTATLPVSRCPRFEPPSCAQILPLSGRKLGWEMKIWLITIFF